VILDTNALSALADGDALLGKQLHATSTASVPAIVLGEYRFGILGSRHRARYEAWLAESLAVFDILPVDAGTALAYAEIRRGLKNRGTPIPENDIWIAALAFQYRLPVLSKDRHFSLIPEITSVHW
jgi:tRNA(fMet)-specific endonuclease VapC